MSEKIKFGSKIGIIAATVGSAVGLGNVWRFPAETQANGGAVFLLIYILCIFILGIPVSQRVVDGWCACHTRILPHPVVLHGGVRVDA